MSYLRPLDVASSRPLLHERGRPAETKLLGLELVRFVCAFAVLVWHYQHFYSIIGAPAFNPSAQPLHALLEPFYRYGMFGVQIFWGISGFIFFWKYGQAIADLRVGGAKFFWLRLSRLYPLHFATLLLVASLQPIHVALTGHSFVYQGNDAPNFVAQLFMATHWGRPTPFTFNGPIWSVSAEVFVYALFFLLVRRFGAGWGTIAGTIAATLAAMTAGFASPVLLCASYFFVGGAAARLFLERQLAGRTSTLVPLSLGALALIAIGSRLGGVTLTEQNIVLLLLAATPPLLLLAAQDWQLLGRWPQTIQAVGNLTYSTYLIHFPMQLLVAVACAATGLVLPVQSPLLLVVYLVATIAIGRWLFLRLERPAQNWIRRQTLAPRPAAA
ncbi:MAG TPA: acyltransferase [Sphingomicrobium sp.]|nr:acyltransferase [Sphingomicrobium sp.]